jgi:leucyl-tRNA synthetase
VNGTLRDVLWVSAFGDEEELKTQAFLSEKVNAAVAGRAIQKIIMIRGRLINIVTQ